MRMFRITNGFTEMTDAYLLVRANFIKNSLTGNTYFPAPHPNLGEFTTAIADFTAAVEAAEDGSRQQIAVKNSLRDALIDKLHLLGNYVLFAAAGDEVAATSSGFNISKQPASRPALTMPQGLVLSNGVNKGELQLKFKRVEGATAYVYEITPSPVSEESTWQSALTTVSKRLFTGLESGKEYNCRVAAIGVKDQLVYSETVSRIAL